MQLAFGMPSYPELGVVLLVGLLVFGRRLPEVGRALGRTIQQLRNGMQDFKQQIDADDALGELHTTVKEIRDVPRTLANPASWDQLAKTPKEPRSAEDAEAESSAPSEPG
ncbi:MAG: twin-arginine translocase TatA/TatE family subunit [Planctomycetota bacterium]